MSLPQDIKYLIHEFLYPTIQQVMKKHEDEVFERFEYDFCNHCDKCGEVLESYYTNVLYRCGVPFSVKCECMVSFIE